MQKRLKFLAPRQITVWNNQTKSPIGKKLLLLDLDSNLEQSKSKELSNLTKKLKSNSLASDIRLGVLTGRSIQAARYRYSELHLPSPAVWISRAGTEIHYADENKSDIFWQDSISVDWNRKKVERVLFDLKDYLSLQPVDQQGPFKVSYLLKEAGDSILPLVRKRLRQTGLAAAPHLRCHWYLDVLPLRASRSEAIRFLTVRWGLSLQEVLIVASQQGDAELLKGLPPTVVPFEHDPSLEELRSQQGVFFSSVPREGVVDGLKYFRFLKK